MIKIKMNEEKNKRKRNKGTKCEHKMKNARSCENPRLEPVLMMSIAYS